MKGSKGSKESKVEPMKEQTAEQELEKAQRDAAAGEAELELSDIEDKNSEAVKLLREWANKWGPKTGNKRLAKVLRGTAQYMAHV